MAGAGPVQSCLFGCDSGEDRLEHYLLCNRVWEVLQVRPPGGLGLSRTQKSLQYMFMATKNMMDEQKMVVAVACYAVARTVHSCRLSSGGVDVKSLLRLYITDMHLISEVLSISYPMWIRSRRTRVS